MTVHEVQAVLDRISWHGVKFSVRDAFVPNSVWVSWSVRVAHVLDQEPIRLDMDGLVRCRDEAEVVESAYIQIFAAVAHELRERFLLDGKHWLEPHPQGSTQIVCDSIRDCNKVLAIFNKQNGFANDQDALRYLDTHRVVA